MFSINFTLEISLLGNLIFMTISFNFLGTKISFMKFCMDSIFTSNVEFVPKKGRMCFHFIPLATRKQRAPGLLHVEIYMTIKGY